MSHAGCIGAAIDITEFKRAQDAIHDYAKQLERSNKELEHFATIASHDLQEPLRKVMLFTDHVKHMDHTLSEEALDDIERIQRATGRMQRLITDLLDLSRVIRRGEPFKKIDLHSVIQEVIAELSYTYQDIRSRVQVTDNMMTIEADLNQIRQMMTQLLDNALKFHKPDQASRVNLVIQGIESNQCQIYISDNGIGMKAEYLDKIFGTFIRLHGAKYPGTGIGLTLVQKIVERHHGSVAVESSPGEGSVFTILLPVIQKKDNR
jgi:light-regulated signal transduction histidine kinase (bacteriophytochrome)